MKSGQMMTGTRQKWILDSGVSQHMTYNKKFLKDYQEFDVPKSVGLGDGRTMEAYRSGQVKISVETTQGRQMKLTWVEFFMFQN